MSDHSASCVVATIISALGLLRLTVWPTNSMYHGAAAITNTVGLLRFAFGCGVPVGLTCLTYIDGDIRVCRPVLQELWYVAAGLQQEFHSWV